MTPIAASTCDGSVAPDEHDEPAAAHTPAWSSATSSASASTPGNPTCALPATLRAPVAVLERAGNRGGQAVDQAVAQGADADDVGGARSHVARSAAAIATAPATFDVPDRSPASWPPPSINGSIAVAVAHDERADALGTAELVRRDRDEVDAGRGAATSSHGTACTASVCTTALGARSRTPATILSSGWIVPTSLFTSITDTTTVRSSTAASNRVEVDDARLRYGDRLDPEALGREPVARREHALVLERRRDHAVGAPAWRGPGGPTPFTARLSASVPPAVNTTSAGADAEQLGDLLPGLLERRLGRPRRGVAAARVAERALQERRHRRHRLGPHRRGGGVSRGR